MKPAPPVTSNFLIAFEEIPPKFDGLEKLISEISGIGRVSTLHEGSVEVESAPGKDIRPEIARNVIKAGFDLLELRSIDLSLEDIFIQLTREEPETPNTDDSDEAP